VLQLGRYGFYFYASSNTASATPGAGVAGVYWVIIYPQVLHNTAHWKIESLLHHLPAASSFLSAAVG